MNEEKQPFVDDYVNVQTYLNARMTTLQRLISKLIVSPDFETFANNLKTLKTWLNDNPTLVNLTLKIINEPNPDPIELIEYMDKIQEGVGE